MLAAASLVLGLTAISPVPVPRPALADAPAPAATQSPAVTEPQSRDDRTLLERMLQDLEQIGDETAPSETVTNAPVHLTPAPEPETAITERDAAIPLPPVRPAVLAPQRNRQAGKGVCGDPRLSGRMVAPVQGKIRACGIVNPVRLTAVNGIKLTTPATLRCDAARTFADWLTSTADPQARRDLGAPISTVWVMASYSCRTRNHRKGARLSEHSFGRAIDIGGFVLGNGRKVTVLDNWGKGTPGRFLRAVWKRACGPFKTVLGPESDRFHRNHFHLDLAKRRSTFCR